MKKDFKRLKCYIWIKSIWMISSAVIFAIGIIGYSWLSFIVDKENFWLKIFFVISIIFLISFIASILFFIAKDPVNNLDKYKLRTMLNYCNLSKGFVVYSETITYITMICNRTANNSHMSKNETEKMIARFWRKVLKEKSPVKNQNQYKKLCLDLVEVMSDNYGKIDENKLNNIESAFINGCDDSDTAQLLKGILKWITENTIIVFNLMALIMILIGFVATYYKVTPLDTYLYGMASLILVVYVIISELKKKLDIVNWVDNGEQ